MAPMSRKDHMGNAVSQRPSGIAKAGTRLLVIIRRPWCDRSRRHPLLHAQHTSLDESASQSGGGGVGRAHEKPFRIGLATLEVLITAVEIGLLQRAAAGQAVDTDDSAVVVVILPYEPPPWAAGQGIHWHPSQVTHGTWMSRVPQQVLQTARRIGLALGCGPRIAGQGCGERSPRLQQRRLGHMAMGCCTQSRRPGSRQGQYRQDHEQRSIGQPARTPATAEVRSQGGHSSP